MIKSMTAYADAELTIDGMVLVCELRSVNHRYGDISIKLPERLRFTETDLRRLIADKLKRGKIECSISYKKQSYNQSMTINHELVDLLLNVAADIEARMTNPQPFSALQVLAFPGVQQDSDIDKEILQTAILQLLTQALDHLLENRLREGAQLAELLIERCHKAKLLVSAGQTRMPEVLNGLRIKLLNRVTELVAEPNFDRLEQELVLMAQKLDVAEELERLEMHVQEVLHTLKQPEPAGRRLDFLMQEMNREANTLGSKSADKEMTQISIDLKVLIEQMREQVQNIE